MRVQWKRPPTRLRSNILTATGQSGKGMLTLFQKLANQSIASLR